MTSELRINVQIEMLDDVRKKTFKKIKQFVDFAV